MYCQALKEKMNFLRSRLRSYCNIASLLFCCPRWSIRWCSISCKIPCFHRCSGSLEYIGSVWTVLCLLNRDGVVYLLPLFVLFCVAVQLVIECLGKILFFSLSCPKCKSPNHSGFWYITVTSLSITCAGPWVYFRWMTICDVFDQPSRDKSSSCLSKGAL